MKMIMLLLSLLVTANLTGVSLIMSSDLILPGNLQKISVHEEMTSWQESTIPAMDSLSDAKFVPELVVNFEDNLKSTSADKFSCNVLMKSQPLLDIYNTQQYLAFSSRSWAVNMTR